MIGAFRMLLFLVVALFFLLIVALCVQDVARELLAPRLEPHEGLPMSGPCVSVLVPARNEEQRIGACLEGLANQRYQSFEVVVVDDHSTDATGVVVERYESRLPSLRLISGAELPTGWAGKCWACWQAAGEARGEWLLFLDADVTPLPDMLGALVERAAHVGADAITLMPLLRLGSLAERLLLPAFQTILYGVYPLRHVSDPRSPIAFANGQALLIRRSVYAALDGHRAVRDSVLEDTDLGQRIKAAGYHLHAAAAHDLFTVRMYDDWPSTAEGLGKNAVAGYRSGGWRSGWVGFRQALIAFGPLYLLGAGAGMWASSAAPLGLVIVAHGAALFAVTCGTTGWLFRRRYRIAPLWALGYPLGLALYYGLALRGLVRVKTGRGVMWKGRILSGR